MRWESLNENEKKRAASTFFSHLDFHSYAILDWCQFGRLGYALCASDANGIERKMKL